MESSVALPAPAIGADDVPDIASLFERAGPFVTVYLGTDPEVENAGQRSLQHWRNVRRDLEAAGAPATALDAIEELVPDAHHTGATLAVVADESGVLHARGELEPVHRDRARYATLPSVGAMLEWFQDSPTHVVVLCDRVGADIAVIVPEGSGRAALLTVGSDESNDPDLRKSKPGGWSQRRFQERAENAWDANAKAVVERLTKLCDIVDPRLVIVAGDVRAVQLLQGNLPDRTRALVQVIEGSRAVDGGLDSVSDDVVKLVASAVAEDTVAIVERFREHLGQGDRACDGVDATLAALCEARVDTLLVHDDPYDERVCWFAPPSSGVALVALTPDALRDQGVDDPATGRMVDAAIATAFRTGARVRVVPSTGVTDGLGAILRF